MWVCCSPTHRLCNSRLGAAALSLNLEGMEAVSSPKNEGGSSQVRTNWMLASFQNFILGTEKKSRARFHPRGKFLHHLITQAWNHNACQMNKWCCGMWKSVVFSENTHGPWRLIPQSCCLSKLPQPKFWVTTKACFLCQDGHQGFHLKIYGLSLVPQVHSYQISRALLSPFANLNLELSNPVSQKLLLYTTEWFYQALLLPGLYSRASFFKSRSCKCKPAILR